MTRHYQEDDTYASATVSTAAGGGGGTTTTTATTASSTTDRGRSGGMMMMMMNKTGYWSTSAARTSATLTAAEEDDDDDGGGGDDDDDDYTATGGGGTIATTTTTAAAAAAAAAGSGMLNRLFSSCSVDPKGSVHRAWGVSLLFVIFYFIVCMVEMANLQAGGGSKALMIAAIWTGMMHLLLGVLGTFVLKRFPTSFSVGFFLGVLTVLANQNLIMFGTFHHYYYGNIGTNRTFATMGLMLCIVLAFFAVLLFHFKRFVVVSSNHIGSGTLEAITSTTGQTAASSSRRNHSSPHDRTDTDYRKYEEQGNV